MWCYKFSTESNSEKIVKICKYLVKLWARVRCLVFFDSQSIILVDFSLVVFAAANSSLHCPELNVGTACMSNFKQIKNAAILQSEGT